MRDSHIINKKERIMKNVKRTIVCVAIMLGMSTFSFAQKGFSVCVGGSFPVGKFAQGGAGDMALMAPTSELGAAATGINGGVKYQFNVLGDLGVFASADLFYNGLKKDVVETVKGDNENVELPSYMNIPLMVGANYTLLKLAGISLWAEAGAGVNFRNITASSASAAVGTLVSGSTESNYDFSASVAWQVGVGVSLSKLSLGVHYYGFGASEISGDTTTSADLGGIFGGETKPIEFTAGKLNPTMLVARLSYTF